MDGRKKIVAIIGGYRREGVVDSAVDQILDAAREQGADITRIFLTEANIAFCRNCRCCTQEPGVARGKCVLEDDMEILLQAVADADALVLASPVNFGTVTAVTKRFVERLIPFAYWPWGTGAPRQRNKQKNKHAVIVVASAAPAIMARPFNGAVKVLRTAADLMGAKRTEVLYIGLAAMRQEARLSARTLRKARRLGIRIAS